jgi:hypothetical protein
VYVAWSDLTPAEDFNPDIFFRRGSE